MQPEDHTGPPRTADAGEYNEPRSQCCRSMSMEVPRSAPQATIHPTGGTPLPGPRAPGVSRQHAPHLGKGGGTEATKVLRGHWLSVQKAPASASWMHEFGSHRKIAAGTPRPSMAYPTGGAGRGRFPGEDAPDDLNPADGMLLEIRLRGTRVQQPLTQGSPLSTGSLLSKQQG